MQTIGHLKIGQYTILVLVRQKKYGRALKLRKSGKLGIYLEDESIFLRDELALLKRLQGGKVISV